MRLELQIIRKDVNEGLSLAIKGDDLEVLAGGGAICFLGFVNDDGGLLEEIKDEGFSSFGVLAFGFRFAFRFLRESFDLELFLLLLELATGTADYNDQNGGEKAEHHCED